MHRLQGSTDRAQVLLCICVMCVAEITPLRLDVERLRDEWHQSRIRRIVNGTVKVCQYYA